MNPNHEKFRPLVVWAANRFHQMYGGSQEDIFQSAWVIFLEAEKNHNPALGTLEKRAPFLILRRLINQRRGEIREARRNTNYRPPENSEFSPAGFLESLSAEVAEVVRIFWERENSGIAKHCFFRVCRERGLNNSAIRAALGEIRAALA